MLLARVIRKALQEAVIFSLKHSGWVVSGKTGNESNPPAEHVRIGKDLGRYAPVFRAQNMLI